MALIAVAKTQGTPTYQRYYLSDPPSHFAILKDLNFRSAYDIPSRISVSAHECFLANDSNHNDIRKLREYPRLTYLPLYSADNPPNQPFYLFILSGKGWEIWKLKPEAFHLLFDQHYHLCVLVARSATNSEIHPPSNIVFTDAFYRKSGQVSFYTWYANTYMVFYPLEGLDETQGYVKVRDSSMSYARYILSGYDSYTFTFWFEFPTIDGNTVLILPSVGVLKVQPASAPPVPDGSVLVTSKNAVFAHYEGIPMNGKVVAPLNVASGQVTVPVKRLYKRFFNLWEEEIRQIVAPKLGCGIWALPSEDTNAKLGATYYYSLNDIGAELVGQHIFSFFESQVTFKVSSRDDKCLYLGLSAYGELLNPTYSNKSPSAEVVSLPVGRIRFLSHGSFRRDDNSYVAHGGTTDFSDNYLFYNASTLPPVMRVSCIIEGEPIPEQKNKDTRVNVVIWDALPKESELRVMTTYLSPSFVTISSFYHQPLVSQPATLFAAINLNDLLENAPVRITVGGIDWVYPHSIFYPTYQNIPYSVDMPVGSSEALVRSDLSSTDTGHGRETVKVLVWQPIWFSHSFTTDPNYGDTLMQFGWKITTIASPPRVEYIVSGFQVCSIWFQNLLKRLRGTELKDVEKQLLRDCVCSLDGFFGAIRVTFHYDKQTGLIYMREWRLGVPFGDPVPLTTFNLQPYHEIRALKDFWSWSLYVDIIDTRTQRVVKRIKIVPTVRSWIVGEVDLSQPIAFTQRKSFANPLVSVNPSSPYTVDRNLNFNQVIERNPHALVSPNLTNTNEQVYKQGNYPLRFYPLQASVTSLSGIPTQYQTAAQKFYGSQVPVVPIQFGNLNAQPIYVASIPIVLEVRAKRDVPYEIIAKWGVGVAIFAAGNQWANLLPYGLADLGELLHWTVVEFWEDQP
jgi:hypothetical protein